MNRNLMQRAAALLLILLCAVFLLTGCRARTYGAGDLTPLHPEDGARPQSAVRENASLSSETEQEDGTPEDDGSGRTKENPDAVRREFDESAPAEIVPGTDRSLHAQGEGAGAPDESEDSGEAVTRLNEQAAQPATQTIAAGQADNMGVSEDAEQADSAMTYFTVLLKDRGDSLFECKRLDLYWETEADRVTVHKSSPEHELILSAGTYDVSARLLPENLRVDDGWIVRKNPGVIVKIVDSAVLGSSVSSVASARSVYRALISREGFSSVDAVRNGRVLLLSREMLDAPHYQLAAAIMIAATANPELYSDVSFEQTLDLLAREASGAAPEGIFYYTGRED